MRFRIVPVLLGMAACQLTVFADGTSVGVCNGGKAEFDANLAAGGATYTKHVKPAECVDWAKSDGQMASATIGIAFTDPKGQYVGAKRFDRVPDWNGPLDAGADSGRAGGCSKAGCVFAAGDEGSPNDRAANVKAQMACRSGR